MKDQSRFGCDDFKREAESFQIPKSKSKWKIDLESGLWLFLTNESLFDMKM